MLSEFILVIFIKIFIFTSIYSSVTFLFFGRFIGRFGVLVLGFFYYFILFCISLYVYYLISKGFFVFFLYSSWISVSLGFNWSFFLDFFSSHMVFLIIIISFLIFLYAFEYLESDPHVIRFLTYLFFFTFFMLVLVSSGNLLQLFLGWEGVGIVSFLLINFWFTRLEANRSAIKAVIFNKIGDLFFIFFIVFVHFFFRTIEIPFLLSIFSFVNLLNVEIFFFGFSFLVNIYSILSVLLFLAAFCKSAQLGLHAWLPDAMEGPTPVSALLHSATMVTAGIFILIRFCTIVFLGGFSNILLIFGSFTAFFGSLFAVFQFDLKKIIAYSTCSQLGFMVSAVGYFNVFGSFFHLFNHAFFKALLFLTAGVLIHALGNLQDIRGMGGLIYYLPTTVLSMFVGFMGLTGFPFFSGFYSKEVLIFCLLVFSDDFVYILSFFLLFSASILTLKYSFSIIYLFLFNRFFFGFKSLLKTNMEPGLFSLFGFFILILFTIFGGFFFEDTFVGLSFLCFGFIGSYFKFIDLYYYPFVFLEREFIFSFFRYFFFFFFIFLINYYKFFYTMSFSSESLLFKLINIRDLLKFRQARMNFLSSVGGSFNILYRSIANFVLFFGYRWFFIIFERGFMEKFGPFGLVNFVFFLSKRFQYLLDVKLDLFIKIVFFFFCFSLFYILSNFFFIPIVVFSFLFLEFII